MKLFTIDKSGKLIPYKEYDFKDSKQETDLEVLLENNPEYFFKENKVLIIGRQITTNLNTFVDLLGIDKLGNTVVVELKRGKTPRETIAQLLEYASFVENLDYSQLNDIYQNYSGEEISLENYHQQYFQNESDEKVSFNKSTKLVIFAQEISKEIRQTALFLRKNGIDAYCIEFKCFETKSVEKIITSDFAVGEEEFIRQNVQSVPLPKVNEKQFLSSLNKNGFEVFQQIFEFAKQNALLVRWGSKGFSLSLEIDDSSIWLFLGYPPNSVFKQSIYIRFEVFSQKTNYPEEVTKIYKEGLMNLDFFEETKSGLKWVIDRSYSESEIKQFLGIIESVMLKIKEKGLK